LPIDFGTSGAGGTFTFTDLPLGVYTVEGSLEGYETATWYASVLDTGINPNQDGSMSPVIGDDEIRIVLSWPKTTELNDDLDSHLVGYTDTGSKFHLAYFDESPTGSEAELDLDNTDRWSDDDTRPETVTISQLHPGLYTYSVHNYTEANVNDNINGTALAASGATVTVYLKDPDTGGTRNLVFNVPAGVKTIWQVFDLDGTTGCLRRLDVSKAGQAHDLTPFDSEENGAGEGPKTGCL
jgi:hypothetical protein